MYTVEDLGRGTGSDVKWRGNI